MKKTWVVTVECETGEQLEQALAAAWSLAMSRVGPCYPYTDTMSVDQGEELHNPGDEFTATIARTE